MELCHFACKLLKLRQQTALLVSSRIFGRIFCIGTQHQDGKGIFHAALLSICSFKIVSFLTTIVYFKRYVYVCEHHTCRCTETRRGCQVLKLNLSPLQQPVLFTAEPSLQPFYIFVGIYHSSLKVLLKFLHSTTAISENLLPSGFCRDLDECVIHINSCRYTYMHRNKMRFFFSYS